MMWALYQWNSNLTNTTNTQQNRNNYQSLLMDDPEKSREGLTSVLYQYY